MNSLLYDAQQAALRKALAEPHSAGDHWCGRTVATWMRTHLGKPVSRHSAWRAVGGKHTATKAIWNAILQQHRDRDKDADGGDPSKNIVAAGLADRIELQVSYAIGVARPLSLFVETFGTGKIADEEIIALIMINQHFRARYDGWFFAVTSSLENSNSTDAIPNDAFVREALWGDGPFAASSMPAEEAERIIQMCAQAFVETTKQDR